MSHEDKINIDIFKVVNRAIAESADLDIMTNHLCQLLVGALEIKACNIFALNWKTEELEILASFGLSMHYLNKGPVQADKSIGCAARGEPIMIRDVNDTDLLQYPDEAKKEGIGAIASLPITIYNRCIGVLRLYHHEPWDISKRDMESLQVLSENIGLALMYTRVLNMLQAVKSDIDEFPSEAIPA